MQKELLYNSVQAYAEQISGPESKLLASLRKETEDLPGSQMLSSVLQGRILALFSHLLQPKSIVEIGTYTGYATLCLAEGLGQEGLLHTIDSNAKVVAVAERYFSQAKKLHQVRFYIGSALDKLAQIQGGFDLVFIDADKRNYAKYYDLVIPHVRSGGLLIADNVLWKGEVCSEMGLQQDIRARAMAGFAYRLQNDRRVAQVCLPVRDGLLVARKV